MAALSPGSAVIPEIVQYFVSTNCFSGRFPTLKYG
jgi:hypothetical protein